MTHPANTINPAEQLAYLAEIHCILVPAQGTDRSRCLAAAQECIQVGRWFPEYQELADEFLALAEALPTADDVEEHLAAQEREVAEQPPPPQRERKPRNPLPDGLKTAERAAAKLGCSIKTLSAHVASGALRYVIIGHGKKRPRRMFTDADLDAFITNQTRKDVPCPSTRTRARHTSSLTSGGEVIAFSAQPRPRPGAKRKR